MSKSFPVYLVDGGNTEPGEPAENDFVIVIFTFLRIGSLIQFIDLTDGHITIGIRVFGSDAVTVAEIQFGDLAVQFTTIGCSRF